jgi:hypothetical protein
MSLNDSIDKLKYDVRMVDINLKSQVLTQAELDKHTKALNDLQSQSMALDLENNSDVDSLSENN